MGKSDSKLGIDSNGQKSPRRSYFLTSVLASFDLKMSQLVLALKSSEMLEFSKTIQTMGASLALAYVPCPPRSVIWDINTERLPQRLSQSIGFIAKKMSSLKQVLFGPYCKIDYSLLVFRILFTLNICPLTNCTYIGLCKWHAILTLN